MQVPNPTSRKEKICHERRNAPFHSMNSGRDSAKGALKSHKVYPRISIVLVNATTKKAIRVPAQAPATVVRRQNKPSQKGAPIMAWITKNHSRAVGTSLNW